MNQNEAIKDYAAEIPKEVRDVINGLSEDIRMAIIVGLLKNEKMTFTELKRLFDLKSSSLSYHLLRMQDGGLVDHIADLKESRSYYKATDIARLVLESLSNIVLGISTPAVRSRAQRVQNPESGQNTSATFNDRTIWIKPDYFRTLMAEQYLPEEDSSRDRFKEEQSPNPKIPTLQTAASRKIGASSY